MCSGVCDEAANGKVVTRRDDHIFTLLSPPRLPHTHSAVCTRCGAEPLGSLPGTWLPASLPPDAGSTWGLPLAAAGELASDLQPNSHKSPHPAVPTPLQPMPSWRSWPLALLPSQGQHTPRMQQGCAKPSLLTSPPCTGC